MNSLDGTGKTIKEKIAKHAIILEQREIPKVIVKELNRVYPGYVLLYLKPEFVWVLFEDRVDYYRKECVLPGSELGWWIFDYLAKMDMSDETALAWKRKVKELDYQHQRRQQRKRQQLAKDMEKDLEHWGRREKVII